MREREAQEIPFKADRSRSVCTPGVSSWKMPCMSEGARLRKRRRHPPLVSGRLTLMLRSRAAGRSLSGLLRETGDRITPVRGFVTKKGATSEPNKKLPAKVCFWR